MDLTPSPGARLSSVVLKKPSSQGKIFEAVLLLIIAILFYFFMVGPKRGELAAADAQYQTLQSQQNGLANTKAQLQKAISDLNSHPQEVADMDEALPLDNRVTKLYIALDSLTQNSGMTVGNISVAFNGGTDMAGNKALLADPYAVQRTVQTLTTTLQVTGSFEQFQALLQKLENSGRLINITGLNITPVPGGSFNFGLNLEAYYYAE
jgi:Tfp pilus assembly protein PilO